MGMTLTVRWPYEQIPEAGEPVKFQGRQVGTVLSADGKTITVEVHDPTLNLKDTGRYRLAPDDA